MSVAPAPAAAQHLIRGPVGCYAPVCGSDDDPADFISADEFREQLGRATGQAVHWEAGEAVPVCSLCATRFIEEQRI